MIVDHIRNRALYYFLGDDFKKALDFFATVSEEPFEAADVQVPDSGAEIKMRPMNTKPEAECSFEAHRVYADIHFVAYGKEQIGYADIKKMQELSYDEEADAAALSGKGDKITLDRGYFLIAFPDDVHMPCICPDSPAPLGKMIAKIKL